MSKIAASQELTQSSVKSLKCFKVLSFDMVGTLIDFERGMVNYLRRSVPGAKVTDEAFLDAYRRARTSEAAGPYPDDLVRAWSYVAKEVGLPDTLELAQAFLLQ